MTEMVVVRVVSPAPSENRNVHFWWKAQVANAVRWRGAQTCCGHDTFCVESVCEDRFSWSGLSVLHARDYRSRMPSESVACLIQILGSSER
jgi:hypothetical protein